jgi:pimeloyl-ACP methyl ester carboxylesterase
MPGITDYEAQEIEEANASGLTPVVFIHGLWLLPSSWDRWRPVFEEAGYATLAPGWPDDPAPSRTQRTPRCSPTRVSGRSPTTSATGPASHEEARPHRASFGGLLTQILVPRRRRVR